jgi:hypothetical protein
VLSNDLLRANLNLYAVLQNLEELVQVDAEMNELARDWALSIQFLVRGGPKAFVTFADGVCTHGRGTCPRATVRLFLASPAHLNRMFDGGANPIPLKGFNRLGFLKNEFGRLTDRLGHYLRPRPELLKDAGYRRINAMLTLQTAAFAVRELALLEPTSRAVASRVPNGTFQIGILPDGPHVCIAFADGAVSVRKGEVARPAALMTFRDAEVASAVLNDRLDAFLAVAEGDVVLRGQIKIPDNVNLILDRVARYLS